MGTALPGKEASLCPSVALLPVGAASRGSLGEVCETYLFLLRGPKHGVTMELVCLPMKNALM